MIIAFLPAFNEELRISSTIASLQAIQLIDKIVVINDASTDNTAAIIRELAVDLIDLQKNVGKGGALNTALAKYSADVYLFIDSDLMGTASEAEKLLYPVVNGECDMAIASFPPAKKKGGFGIVKKFAKWIIKRKTGWEMQSPISGQRAINARLMNYLGGFASGYGVEVAMTLDAFSGGFNVMEIPVQMYHNETGRDLNGFLHRGKQLYHIIWMLFVRSLKRKI